ncbi:tetratricopeptide repeat protein [candidate division WOR-3 bacterium]|jgi:Tfp pilus assembly protein PilF|nr:tetratricopeptide repeat protein [candidate division WOR-3 bacterium]
MKFLIPLLVIILIVSNCASAAKSPGQVVASENNFENGVKQYEKGHIKQAIHQFEKAIEKNPANFKAYFYLGRCYKQRGTMETAHKHFQKAIDLNPNDKSWVIKVKAEMETAAPKKGKGKQK